MLTPELPKENAPIAVAPRKAEIVLAETSRLRLELFMPLLEELKDIEQYDQSHASLTETSLGDLDRKRPLFRAELEQLERKEKKFGQFGKFLNRAANLAARAGNAELEEEYLRRAQSVSDDSFVRNRIADLLIADGRFDQSRKLLATSECEEDIGAILRFAAMHVLESNYRAAASTIEDAVKKDPSNAAARLFQGGLALFLGESRKAIRAFRVAAEARPNSSVIHTNLALAYVRLGEVEKAFDSLRRAIAFAPLNLNAVSVLADLAYEHNRSEDAIPSLQYLLTCEQKNAGIWARLARANLQVGNNAQAVDALKHQAGIESSSSVWNNLGVAYMKAHKKDKAVAAFAYAMELAVEKPNRGFFLAGRNTAQFLVSLDRDKEVLRFTTELLKKDTAGLCLTDKALSDVYAFHLHALRREGMVKELRKVATSLIDNPRATEKIRMWAMGVTVAHSALLGDCFALRLIDEQITWLRSIPKVSTNEYTVLFNNVAFALAEYGRAQEAREFLHKIIDKVGREPYPTATKGLIDMREGKFERGIKNYEKAISLAVGRLPKSRIKQKLYLEKARRLISDDVEGAKRLLSRVVKMQPGEEILAQRAKDLLREIPHKSTAKLITRN